MKLGFIAKHLLRIHVLIERTFIRIRPAALENSRGGINSVLKRCYSLTKIVQILCQHLYTFLCRHYKCLPVRENSPKKPPGPFISPGSEARRRYILGGFFLKWQKFFTHGRNFCFGSDILIGFK